MQDVLIKFFIAWLVLSTAIFIYGMTRRSQRESDPGFDAFFAGLLEYDMRVMWKPGEANRLYQVYQQRKARMACDEMMDKWPGKEGMKDNL